MVGKTISHYKIIEKLGAGGMGEVYLAEDTRLDRKVALKFLPLHFTADTESLARFEREAKATAVLNHPNIITIYEIGDHESQTFIAMEYVEGESLRERMAKQLSLSEILELIAQICSGLGKAHEADVVHRDIKPENIMIDKDGRVRILDFGLAKLKGVTKLTREASTLGTLNYMSPEQFQALEVDHRTDIWSLGVILYEMITGELPFAGDYEAAVMYSVLNEDVAAIASSQFDVPGQLEQVINETLAKNPDERYESIESIILDLQKVFAVDSKSRPTPRSAVQEARPINLSEAEKRQLTILQSSLVGYIDLIENIVAEEVETVMNEIRDICTEIVNRTGGEVNEFSNGEIVALFGISTTHEDDCARAVRAALELHACVRDLGAEIERRTGQALQVSTGISTGPVVAQLSGNRDRKYEITGSSVQVAATLATQAAVNEVLVSPESQRLISPYFETEALEPVPFRGKARPVTPYCVVGESGLKTRFEAAQKIGLTRFTGREKELQTLHGCLENALAGEGQFVTIVGEAGVGKSRLLHEFRQVINCDKIKLLHGGCQSYGKNIPYLPFIEALKDGLQLRKEDSQERSLERAGTHIRAIDPALVDYIHLYLHLLSIQNDQFPLPKHLEGEHLRLALVEALSAIFTLFAKRCPSIFILEDWHWVDEASQEVLRQLVEMVSAYPLLIIVTYRPDFSSDWGNPSFHSHIHLRSLEASSSLSIMKSVLQARRLPENLANYIHGHTGGNPFFIEEVCHTLLEGGTLKIDNGQVVLTGTLKKLQLPDTVQAVIRTRLDRLDHANLKVLRHASVIGREFTRRILERILTDKSTTSNRNKFIDETLGQSLGTLKALGLIQQIRVLPEATYSFKHVLMQKVAYESLLLHKRKILHETVGQALEELSADRIEEQLDFLVHHFGHAENWKKAVRYAQQSAERSRGQGQFSEAFNILEKAQRWLLNLPDDSSRQETLIDILLQMERLRETLGARNQQQELINQLLVLLVPQGNSPRLAEVYLRQGDLYTLRGQFEEADKTLEKSLAISRELSDSARERNTLRSIGFLRWYQGRLEEGIAANEKALSIDRKKGDPSSVAIDLNNIGSLLRTKGEHKRALTYLTEALKIHKTIDDPINFVQTLQVMANVYRDLGQIEEAMSYFRRAYEIQTQYHLILHQPITLNSMASIYWEQGNVDESLRLYKEIVQLTRDTKNKLELSLALCTLGQCLLSLDKANEALPCLLESTELFAHLEDHKNQALAWSEIARIYGEKPERRHDAQVAWEKVRKLRMQINDHLGEIEALEGLAHLVRQKDDLSQTILFYQEALCLAEEINDSVKQGELLNSMGILEWKRDEYDKALTHYEKALQIFQQLGDQVHQGLGLNSIGVTLRKLKRYEEAIARLEEASEINRQTGQRLLEGHSLAALAEVDYDMGKIKQAINHYDKSLKIRRGIGDRKGEGWMLYHLARVHASQKSQEQARNYLSEASKIAIKCKDIKLQGTCKQLQKSIKLRRK